MNKTNAGLGSLDVEKMDTVAHAGNEKVPSNRYNPGEQKMPSVGKKVTIDGKKKQ